MTPLIVGPAVHVGRRRGLLVSSSGGSPPPPPWSPPDPGGLAYWGDAATLSSLYQDNARTTLVTADGQPVGSFGDVSGLGHHLGQSTSGLRLTYTATGGAGGGPGVQASTGQFLKSAAFSMADCTFVLAAKITGGYLITHYDGGANGVYAYDPSGYTAVASRGGGGGGASFNDASVWSAGFAVYTLRVEGAAPLLSLYRDGALVGSSNLPIGTTPQSLSLTLAADVNGSFGGAVIYSEILVYDHALSLADRADAETYLAGRWGL